VGEHFPAYLDHGERVVIAIGNVMAFVQVTPAYKHPVRSVGESTEHKCQVDSSAAHDADQLDIGCVLLSGNSSQVGSAVRSPVTYETEHSWLECRSCSHFSSSLFWGFPFPIPGFPLFTKTGNAYATNVAGIAASI
jgi:hypothetical protein